MRILFIAIIAICSCHSGMLKENSKEKSKYIEFIKHSVEEWHQDIEIEEDLYFVDNSIRIIDDNCRNIFTDSVESTLENGKCIFDEEPATLGVAFYSISFSTHPDKKPSMSSCHIFIREIVFIHPLLSAKSVINHEVGHCLGFIHSGNRKMLMHAAPIVSSPHENEIEIANRIYLRKEEIRDSASQMIYAINRDLTFSFE